jgi:hypothetical protein
MLIRICFQCVHLELSNTPLSKGLIVLNALYKNITSETEVIFTTLYWLGKLFLFQTFDELDRVKDKEAEVLQIRQLIDNDQKEMPAC